VEAQIVVDRHEGAHEQKPWAYSASWRGEAAAAAGAVATPAVPSGRGRARSPATAARARGTTLPPRRRVPSRPTPPACQPAVSATARRRCDRPGPPPWCRRCSCRGCAGAVSSARYARATAGRAGAAPSAQRSNEQDAMCCPNEQTEHRRGDHADRHRRHPPDPVGRPTSRSRGGEPQRRRGDDRAAVAGGTARAGRAAAAPPAARTAARRSRCRRRTGRG
jgi:hypothetical protein